LAGSNLVDLDSIAGNFAFVDKCIVDKYTVECIAAGHSYSLDFGNCIRIAAHSYNLGFGSNCIRAVVHTEISYLIF
jgi:hypothetical protein